MIWYGVVWHAARWLATRQQCDRHSNPILYPNTRNMIDQIFYNLFPRALQTYDAEIEDLALASGVEGTT